MFRLLLSLFISSTLLISHVFAQSLDAQSVDRGRNIYLKGMLPDGKPLMAMRENGEIHGADAACVQCHRESGLGGTEGNIVIPPISGPALFDSDSSVIVEEIKKFNNTLSKKHNPYNSTTLARAIREGVNYSNDDLNALMPRFKLSSAEMNDLIAYLKTLSASPSAGVNEKEIHIATVLTPEVSQSNKVAFIETIQAMVEQHNVNVVSGLRQKISPIERRMQNRRKWRLDIWSLTGPSSGWTSQLEELQRQDPAFAVVSGISTDWNPVQNFCEKNNLPCWLPSLDVVPYDASKALYSMYFNEGITLDAKVIASKLMNQSDHKIIQLFDKNTVSIKGKENLDQLLLSKGFKAESISLDWNKADDIKYQLEHLKASDSLVLWLDREHLEKFTKEYKAPLSRIYYSDAILSGINLPETWDSNAWVISKIELPELRSVNLIRFKDWAKFRNLAISNEKMQSEVYFSLNAFSWMVSSMLNNFYPHYLIERAESNLSMRDAMQVQEEVQAMMMGGEARLPQNSSNRKTTAKMIDKNLLIQRHSSSIYPRISFGFGQRFASKGAYVLHRNTDSNKIDSEWVIPPNF